MSDRKYFVLQTNHIYSHADILVGLWQINELKALLFTTRQEHFSSGGPWIFNHYCDCCWTEHLYVSRNIRSTCVKQHCRCWRTVIASCPLAVFHSPETVKHTEGFQFMCLKRVTGHLVIALATVGTSTSDPCSSDSVGSGERNILLMGW